jgi:D-alanine-D-alanine ligase
VGLGFVEHVEEWPSALAAARRHGERILLEEWVRGREVTVGVIENDPLPVVEIRPRSGRYDYRSKYTPGSTEYCCPADFDAALTRRIQALGLAAFDAIGGRDYGRVDLLVPESGAPTVLEVNTLPGMTETSLLPKAAAAAGIDFPALCQRMVELALARAGTP